MREKRVRFMAEIIGGIAIVAAILLEGIPPISADAASMEPVILQEFVKELEEATETKKATETKEATETEKATETEEVTETEEATETEETIETKEILMKEKEFDVNKKVTWKEAVVLANRADIRLNGDAYDKERYNQVKKKQRLSGLGELNPEERKAARLCFVKGIIAGDSMGLYSQARKLQANAPLTRTQVDKLIARIKDKTQRIKLSPDGQVIRTTNLPKNYKYFTYILASFPNKFYEKKFKLQYITYSYKPVRFKHYAYPKDIFKDKNTYNTGYLTLKFKDMYNEYGDEWLEKIKTNLECRLNFDYRTVNNEWISKLHNTYYIYPGKESAYMNKRKSDAIKEYVNKAKKNHVIVKTAQIAIEPSTMYEDLGDFYVRCHIKLKITADQVYNGDSEKQAELVYSGINYMYLPDLKKGAWYEGNFEVAIGGTAGGDGGETFAVTSDYLGTVGDEKRP
ncbi:MAG: hypothetical protein RR056_04545 [Acetivibrio sp.]